MNRASSPSTTSGISTDLEYSVTSLITTTVASTPSNSRSVVFSERLASSSSVSELADSVTSPRSASNSGPPPRRLVH